MVRGRGGKVAEHRSAGPLTLHVLGGSVIFRSGGRAPTVAAGELLVLEAAIDHEVSAVEESVILLTLAEHHQHHAQARLLRHRDRVPPALAPRGFLLEPIHLLSE
jgi:quercetin dioxygenase-like cupin family protein